MAKLYAVLGIALGLLAGCQQPAILGSLPSPYLDGPTIAQTPVPPVRPAPPAPPVTAKPPVPPQPGLPAEWRPNAGMAMGDWKYIVIHHSDTPRGGALSFDRWHKQRGWDGLGYHFVIGNGTDTKDGQVEVGFRWREQREGAHAKTPGNYYNIHGIGICLVGNFEVDRPTKAQLNSLARLVACLMDTYHIPAERIVGHRDVKSTDCPGRNMDVAVVRRMATQLAQKNSAKPAQANAGQPRSRGR